MKKRRVITLALAIVLLLTIVPMATPGSTAYAQGGPPKVVCVPATAFNPAVPHDTWSGLEITLKGTAHDPDGDATLDTYQWDFGDGSPPETGSVPDPYAIEARHTYVGSVGDLFVATLTVTDTSGQTDSDQYLVAIRDGADIKVKVNVAIDEGLWYLHKQQNRGTYGDGTDYGYWPSGHPASNTGAATEAFEIQGSLPDGDVNEDPYVETVKRGLNYLLANTHVHSVPVQTYGNPDANGNGKGLGSYTDSGRTMYEVGITTMAFASSQSPDRIAETGDANWVMGRTYADIVQDMVDYLAWGQNEGGGCNRGGWRYSGNYSDSDNSVSQWPVIGMEAAETNFGSTIPAFVRSELQLWLNQSQNSDGGFFYGCGGCTNVARTGAGMAMMSFVGIPTADARFQNALSYLDTHWTDNHGCMGSWDYHFSGGGNYYAFYGVMKGARLPDPDVEMIGSRDWYADYADFITGDQEAYGGWLAYEGSHNPYLATAWAILTLKKTVVQPGPVADAGPDVPNHPPIIEVTFDGRGSFHRDPSRNIVQYIWDFGDGSPPAEGTVVTHGFPAIYNPDGTIDWAATARDYVVTLTVVDDSDPALTDADTATVHITPPPWPPVADADGPYEAYQCWPLTLDGSGSYDPNGELYPNPDHPWHGELVSWEWDLDNDGVYDDATGETTTWSSCDLGVHVVGLKVTNTFGASDEVDTVINVVEPPPEADGQVLSMAVVDPPAEIDVSHEVPITVREEVVNNGPAFQAEFDVTFNATPPEGCNLVGPDQIVERVTLPALEPAVVEAIFTIHCSEPSWHTFAFDNVIEVVSWGVSDPNPGNNTGDTSLTVAAIAYADVEIADWVVPTPSSLLAPVLGEGYLLISEWVTMNTVKTLHNQGPRGPVNVVGATMVQAPGIDVSGPDGFAVDDLAVSVPVDLVEDFAFHCYEPSLHTITLINEITDVEPDDIHVVDPDTDNNRVERTLEIECVIPVPVDIKPTSCRNPLNVGKNGVLPVAILGTEGFDVTEIDPETVTLMGVAPLRWAMEDVAIPFEPYIGKQDAFDCTEEGPDGYMDLTLKFDAQEIVGALGEVSDGDVLVLHLTGDLQDEFGDHTFYGEDVIVILKKGKK